MRTLPVWLVNSSVLFCLLASRPTAAQIVPDASLPVNSSVTPNGNTNIITEGTRAGSNLFHSFEQFSIPTGSAVYFNNALDIQNIISRVTGSSVSNIDGLIRANASANLFLLNANGIIFGPNATLAIGGSFLASTASGLNFADGTQFSATAHSTTALLTISVPLGLQFGSNPAGIRVQGTGHSLTLSNPIFSPFTRSSTSTGLKVKPGKTLALVGGDIALEGGSLTAEQGRIELGSVGSGSVNFSLNTTGWTFGYQGVQSFEDIRLSQRALVDASGEKGGDIQLSGRIVTLADGSVALIQNQGSQPGGSLSVNASESLEVNGTSSDGMIPTSFINETVGDGNGGNIGISTERLLVQNGAAIANKTYTTARGGNLSVNAPESVQVIGFSSINPQNFSVIATGTFGSKDAGDITVATGRLTVKDGGNMGSVTFGTGDGGSLTVNATDVELSGVTPIFSLPSDLFSSSGGAGNAGTLTINTSRLRIRDGALLATNAAATGNAGSIFINASKFVQVSGRGPNLLPETQVSSSATSDNQIVQQLFRLPPIPSGASGDVTINTPRLTITNSGRINIANYGSGKAGTLRLNVGSLILDNKGRITAASLSGEGGNIFLQANSLQLGHNSTITATALGRSGDGGNININTQLLVALENSNIIANAQGGTGGRVTINTQGLFLSPNSTITATSEAGPQFNGIVQINTLDVDPSRAIFQPVAQPETPKVASVCQRGSDVAASEFVITGRGGIPTAPSDLLSSNTGWEDNFVPAQSPVQNQQEIERLTTTAPTQLVEAQGWVQTPDGRIILTAEPSTNTLLSSADIPTCGIAPTPKN